MNKNLRYRIFAIFVLSFLVSNGFWGCAATINKPGDMSKSTTISLVNVEKVASISYLTGFEGAFLGAGTEKCEVLSADTKQWLAATLRFSNTGKFKIKSNTIQLVDSSGQVLFGKRGDPLICRRRAGAGTCPWAKGNDSVIELFLGDYWFWRTTAAGDLECTILLAAPAESLRGAAVTSKGELIGLVDSL